MKIEKSHIAMQSEHVLKHKTAITFESLLEPVEGEATILRNPQDEERRFLDQLHFSLIRQLLEILQGCGCKKGDFIPVNEPTEYREEFPVLRKEHLSVMQSIHESETLDVSMKGCVKTDKGSIDLDIRLSMSRSFVETRQVASEDFIDPLVINLKGELPNLSSKTFCFDIDNDGEKDQISQLGEGCGFLALDKNGNGEIDTGNELFGTKNGNGFVELAQYDSDNNCWIDANDPILECLRIWMVNDGKKSLMSLGEAGIGAIYLGQTHSPFVFKNGETESLGRIRSSGLFLYEDGHSGTAAQIDLAKRQADQPLAVVKSLLGEALQAV